MRAGWIVVRMCHLANRPPNRPTDKAYYRGALAHLKTVLNVQTVCCFVLWWLLTFVTFFLHFHWQVWWLFATLAMALHRRATHMLPSISQPRLTVQSCSFAGAVLMIGRVKTEHGWGVKVVAQSVILPFFGITICSILCLSVMVQEQRLRYFYADGGTVQRRWNRRSRSWLRNDHHSSRRQWRICRL